MNVGKREPARDRRGRAFAVVLVLSLLAIAPAAFAGDGGGTTTKTTEHFVGTVSFPNLNPCTDAAGTETQEVRSIFHTTTLADGTSHVTGTITGTFTLAADVTFTGRFTLHFGTNANPTSANDTFTLSARGATSDGSELRAHVVAHVVASPRGNSLEFEKSRLECS